METRINTIKDVIDARQPANREIISIISDTIEKHPELRFGQILMILGVLETIYDTTDFPIALRKTFIKDPFNEESIYMLKRIKKTKANE
jgi:hypothetical protein